MYKPILGLVLLGNMVFLTACGVAKQALRADWQSEQIVVVVTPNETATQGVMRLYEWRGTNWAAASGFVRVKVGRSGLAWAKGLHSDVLNVGTLKKEGDGKAPQGVFRLNTFFGYQKTAENTWKMPYIEATPATICVDDITNADYNKIVIQNEKAQPASFENMRRSDAQYEFGIVVDYNRTNTEKGAGSCIFMHVQDDTRPTSGCTAMLRKDMRALMAHLDSRKKPVLLQCVHENYAKLAKTYQLPDDWGIITAVKP